MKKIIALLLVAAMAFAVMAGCNPTNVPSTPGGSTDNPAATPGSTTDVTYQDVYKTTFSSSITTLNPYATEYTSDYWFTANFLDALLETDATGVLVPALAESWEHNEDYTVWTFHLRQNIPWVEHTGEITEFIVDADDFVSGLRYVADPMSPVENLSTIRNVIAGLADYYYLLSDIDDGTVTTTTREDAVASFGETVGIKALDQFTVEYTLASPCPFFDSFAQQDLLLPVEQSFLDVVGEEYGTDKDKLLYNGGYYISTWDRDKQITMTKNPYYWDVENLNVTTLSFEYVADSSTAIEMFKRGDLSTVSLSYEEVASLSGTEWADYVYLADKTPVTFWYSFNFGTKNTELAAAVQNENFRKAIFTAIDAVTISALYEPNDPAFFTRYTLLPENTMIDPDGVDYTDYEPLKAFKDTDPFSAEQAKTYMQAAIAELCEADGVTLKGVSAGSVDMLPIAQFDVDGKLPIDIVYSSGASDNERNKAAIVEQMLETYLGKENVNVILAFAQNSFSSEVYDLGNWDLVDDSYSFRYADPSANLDRLVSDYDLTDSAYSIPEYDAMILAADTTYDIKARYAAFAAAEAWLLEHAYVKPYMSGGGSYWMTYVVPFTTPGGGFGRSQYKLKGALIQTTPVTNAQYEQLKAETGLSNQRDN